MTPLEAAEKYAAITADRDRYKALYEESSGQALDLSTKAVEAGSEVRALRGRMNTLENRLAIVTRERNDARRDADALRAQPRVEGVVAQLVATLHGLERMQQSAVDIWRAGWPDAPDEAIWHARATDGRPLLADIVVARANVLLALEAREAREADRD